MFFIFDCNDQIVGNPEGYNTMRGAQTQCDNHRAPAYRAIWAAIAARDARDDAAGVPHDKRDRGICSIRLIEGK